MGGTEKLCMQGHIRWAEAVYTWATGESERDAPGSLSDSRGGAFAQG